MKKKSYKVAFGGMMTAVGAVIMILGSMLSIATYAAPLFASLVMIPVIDKIGKSGAWMVWVATSLLAFFLCADKETAFFYIFIGYYPIIKGKLDAINSTPLRIVSKIAVFTVSIAAMYLCMIYLFRLDAVIAEMKESGTVMNIVMFVILVGIMLVFDVLIERLTAKYRKRFRNGK